MYRMLRPSGLTHEATGPRVASLMPVVPYAWSRQSGGTEAGDQTGVEDADHRYFKYQTNWPFVARVALRRDGSAIDLITAGMRQQCDLAEGTRP